MVYAKPSVSLFDLFCMIVSRSKAAKSIPRTLELEQLEILWPLFVLAPQGQMLSLCLPGCKSVCRMQGSVLKFQRQCKGFKICKNCSNIAFQIRYKNI